MPVKKPAAEQLPDLIEVELARPHTHKGRDYTPGDKLKLSPERAEWLRAKGVAKPESAPEN